MDFSGDEEKHHLRYQQHGNGETAAAAPDDASDYRAGQADRQQQHA